MLQLYQDAFNAGWAHAASVTTSISSLSDDLAQRLQSHHSPDIVSSPVIYTDDTW